MPSGIWTRNNNTVGVFNSRPMKIVKKRLWNVVWLQCFFFILHFFIAVKSIFMVYTLHSLLVYRREFYLR